MAGIHQGSAEGWVQGAPRNKLKSGVPMLFMQGEPWATVPAGLAVGVLEAWVMPLVLKGLKRPKAEAFSGEQ